MAGWGRSSPPFRASESSPPPNPPAPPPQFTEEKFGQAEKTELDAHFENLLARADSTKNWTEKILRQTEVLLQPNPSEWAWVVLGAGRSGGRGWRDHVAGGGRQVGFGLGCWTSDACWWVEGGQSKKSVASVMGSETRSLAQRKC